MVGFTKFVVFTFVIHAVVGYWERTKELKRKVEEISKQYEYPEEFVNDFVSTLKPEELERFNHDVRFNVGSFNGLDMRFGDRLAGQCEFNYKLSMPRYAKDENNTFYFVLNTEKAKQGFEVQICNLSSGSKCKFEVHRRKKNELVPSCCKQEMKLRDMFVIPVPVEKIKIVRTNKKSTLMVDNKEYFLDGLHPKKLFIESECKCQDPTYRPRNLQCC